MNIELNKTKDFDMPFLGTMLYEAVFGVKTLINRQLKLLFHYQI